MAIFVRACTHVRGLEFVQIIIHICMCNTMLDDYAASERMFLGADT